MSIVNSIGTYAGQDFQVIQSLAQTVTAAALTVRVPTSGSISPTVTRGLWRCKVYNPGGTSPSITSVTLTAGDGTNTVTLDNFVNTATLVISSTAYMDVMGDFICDTAASSTGGLSGTLIFGGATFFTYTFVVAGTSSTFSVDAEIAAVP